MMRCKNVIIAAAVIAASLSGHSLKADTVTLKLADRFPPDHYLARNASKFWMEKVSELTDGRVTFDYFPTQQLGQARDMLDLVLAGVADVTEITPSFISERLPLSTVATLPATFQDACEGSRIVQEMVGPDGFLQENEYGPLQLRVIFAITTVPYQILSRDRLSSLTDLRGQKLRSTGGAMDLTLSNLGAVPVRTTAAEAYEALSRRTIDGVVMPSASVVAYDLNDYTRGGTAGANFGGAMLIYAMRESLWQELSAEVREAMLDAGETAAMRTCAAADAEEEQANEMLRQGGTEFLTLSPEDMAALEQASAPIGEDWASDIDSRGQKGSETLATFMEILGRLREE